MRAIHGKRVVLTGGAMGIGLSTAKRLLKERCTVTIWDIRADAIEQALSELAPLGKAFGYVCDVTDKRRVYELAATAVQDMGQVDILINNAGVVFGGNLLDKSDEDWERTIAVNLTSLLYTIRAFLPAMYERNEGHIVNLSSASSTLGVGGLSVYTATKWAVWGLTESLRFEALNLGKKGVRYSSIHPSYIATGLFAGAKLKFPGSVIAPLIKNHDVIAKAIVESALKRGRHAPKRPWTVHLNPRLRGLLPDSWFQRLLILLGIPDSMHTWKGREG
jgi:all-trans-retinol dehydrogenase (NAD+)